jgi:putative ubiquitin-RnfH superfamily antitoxin RatB of RatAB toxin-antitoxin module
MDPVEPLRIEVVWSPAAGDVRHTVVTVPGGSTLRQGLHCWAALADPLHHSADWTGLKVGIWGRIRPLDTPLRANDRIELYRPLTVDPKEARRLRYKNRGERIVSRHRPLAGKPNSC